MRLGHVWGLLAISLVLLPTVVVAQTAGLAISGYVRDETTQEPLTSARVSLQGTSGEMAAPNVLSGTTGEFHFQGLPAGDYYISVEEAGYRPTRVQVSLSGIARSNVIVPLQNLHPGDGPSSHEPVSVHQLSVPAKARDAYDKGVALLSNDRPDYRRALSQFQQALKNCPTYYEAYAEMSIADFHLGEPSAAEQALRKSVELSANRYPKALFLLAELLNDLDRFAEAEPIARQAVASDDTSWQSHYQLARTLAGLKRSSEAEVSARRALELQPKMRKSRWYSGMSTFSSTSTQLWCMTSTNTFALPPMARRATWYARAASRPRGQRSRRGPRPKDLCRSPNLNRLPTAEPINAGSHDRPAGRTGGASTHVYVEAATRFLPNREA